MPQLMSGTNSKILTCYRLIQSVSTPPEGWPDTQLLFMPSLYPNGLDEQTEVYVLKSPRYKLISVEGIHPSTCFVKS